MLANSPCSHPVTAERLKRVTKAGKTAVTGVTA